LGCSQCELETPFNTVCVLNKVQYTNKDAQ
jgi:hypothetical protein